jgi:hypothetical protein
MKSGGTEDHVTWKPTAYSHGKIKTARLPANFNKHKDLHLCRTQVIPLSQYLSSLVNWYCLIIYPMRDYSLYIYLYFPQIYNINAGWMQVKRHSTTRCIKKAKGQIAIYCIRHNSDVKYATAIDAVDLCNEYRGEAEILNSSSFIFIYCILMHCYSFFFNLIFVINIMDCSSCRFRGVNGWDNIHFIRDLIWEIMKII